MENYLKAYRFSEIDLIQMLSLKTLFTNNGYNIDLFPEVYFDSFDNYERLYGKTNKETHDDTPDYFAVYHFFLDETDSPITKEGIIVLFEDRIQNFCKRKALNEYDVCHVILNHELGHWLCHWPTFDGENWNRGYGIVNLKTHESLAQLIGWWCVNGNFTLENILSRNLTPADISDPYALYLNLKLYSKSDILIKLVEIRKNYFLSDDSLFEFLAQSTYSNLFEKILSEFNDDKDIPKRFNYLFENEKMKSEPVWLNFIIDLKDRLILKFNLRSLSTTERNDWNQLINDIHSDLVMDCWKRGLAPKTYLENYRGKISARKFGL